MEKTWVIKNQSPNETIERLSKELGGINKLICNILIQRGITTFEEANFIFCPSLKDLHDPFKMKNMSIAVNRIEDAIKKCEKILVYGDYDVDGTTAVSTMFEFLSSIYNNLGYYIPDRQLEGYGISTKGIKFAKSNDYKLVIALDCGIRAVEKMKFSQELGVDFIICDHHLPGPEIPCATAVLDPKQEDCDYPFKELSGCGVGFKLIQAIAQSRNIPFEQLIPLLDMVAVSIAADIVQITGENRILAFEGLKRINICPRKGIQLLLDSASPNEKFSLENRPTYTISDLVFKIAPRINAAGRMASGSKAVELLLSGDEKIVQAACVVINEENKQRKDLDKKITADALQMIEAAPTLKERNTTVVFSENWHKGVIGIVASRLIESYYLPTIVLTKTADSYSGSARSVGDFNIHDAISKCSDLIEQFGGHNAAAGLTIKAENLIKFRQKFEEVVSASITKEQLTQKIKVDAKLNFRDISTNFLAILKRLGPFGPGNMKPVFLTEGLKDLGEAQLMGEDKSHLRMRPQQRNDTIPAIGGKKIAAIAFKQGDKYDYISQGKPFNMIYTFGENFYKGNHTIQLDVLDIKEPRK